MNGDETSDNDQTSQVLLGNPLATLCCDSSRGHPCRLSVERTGEQCTEKALPALPGGEKQRLCDSDTG